jgi:hypothetical protein
MKRLVLLLAITLSATAFGQKQKITVDDDTVKVDGIAYCILDKSPGLGFDFTVKSLEGTELFFMQFLEFNNPTKISNSNKSGRVTYFEVTFFNDKQKCEVDSEGGKKSVAKWIVQNNLVQDGAVNQEAENKVVLINGMKFTQERQSLGGGTTVIINNR